MCALALFCEDLPKFGDIFCKFAVLIKFRLKFLKMNAKDMESMVLSREKRRNAGARMAELLNKEDCDEFYQSTYGGFFDVRFPKVFYFGSFIINLSCFRRKVTMLIRVQPSPKAITSIPISISKKTNRPKTTTMMTITMTNRRSGRNQQKRTKNRLIVRNLLRRRPRRKSNKSPNRAAVRSKKPYRLFRNAKEGRSLQRQVI